MKRASIEPNFHGLYISFMDALGSPSLRKFVLRETYRNIKVCVFQGGMGGAERERERKRERGEGGEREEGGMEVVREREGKGERYIHREREREKLHIHVLHFPLQVILRADKTTNNFSDRAILKNLGHWLGMQTLAKNKAILQNVRHTTTTCMYMYMSVSMYMSISVYMYMSMSMSVSMCMYTCMYMCLVHVENTYIYMCSLSLPLLSLSPQDLAVKDLVREAHYKGEKVGTFTKHNN